MTWRRCTCCGYYRQEDTPQQAVCTHCNKEIGYMCAFCMQGLNRLNYLYTKYGTIIHKTLHEPFTQALLATLDFFVDYGCHDNIHITLACWRCKRGKGSAALGAEDYRIRAIVLDYGATAPGATVGKATGAWIDYRS
jgi:hypothetical protein